MFPGWHRQVCAYLEAGEVSAWAATASHHHARVACEHPRRDVRARRRRLRHVLRACHAAVLPLLVAAVWAWVASMLAVSLPHQGMSNWCRAVATGVGIAV